MTPRKPAPDSTALMVWARTSRRYRRSTWRRKRWDHLRVATTKQNGENLGNERANNTSGVRGVYWVKSRRKWRAGIQMSIFVGEFDSLEEAAEAVRAKRNELHTYNDADRTA